MKDNRKPESSNLWLEDKSQLTTNQSLVPVSRRNFLIGSAVGATGLALSPLEKLLAASGNKTLLPALYSAEPDQGLLSLLFKFARGLATVLGFGGLFETAYLLLDTFVFKGKLSKLEKENAEKGLGAAWDRILGNQTRYGKDFKFIDLKKIVQDEAKKVLSTAFASETSKASQGSHHATLAGRMFSSQQPDDMRYFATSFGSDGRNIMAPFFDYDGKNYDPRIILGYPSLEAYKQLFNKGNLTRVYKNREQIRQIIYPHKELEAAYGVVESTYKGNDRYDSAAGNRVEMHYEVKGPFKGLNAKPGQMYGVVTTTIGGLECIDSRKRKVECKFTDLVIW